MKWTNVRDAKPDHCVMVSVLVEGRGSNGNLLDEYEEYTGYISFRDRWLLNAPDFDQMGHTVDGYTVRYWMPLPKRKPKPNKH